MADFIGFLRSEGVLHYKGDNFEVTLLPEKPEVIAKERKTVADEIFEPKKRGADGQTAEQQLELYGAVLDAEQ